MHYHILYLLASMVTLKPFNACAYYRYQMVHYLDTTCIPQVAHCHCFHTHQVFPFVQFTENINFFPEKV